MSKQVGRNDPCPCGSGKKFKHCCLGPHDASPRRTPPSYVIDPADQPAQHLPAIEGLGDIRPYLDAVAHRHPLLALPRDEAVVHTVRACQAMKVNSQVRSVLLNDLHGFLEPTRRLQDALKYLVYKVYTRCPEGGDPSRTSLPAHLQLAEDALECFQGFSVIHDAILSVKAGFVGVEIDSAESSVRFSYLDPAIATEVRVRTLGMYDEAGAVQRTAAEDISAEGGRRAILEIARSVQLDQKRHELRYVVPPGALEEFISEVAKADRVECDLPEEWSVGPYTVGDHRRFWQLLKAVSMIHSFALIRLAGGMGLSPAVAGAELRFSVDQLVRDCERILGLKAQAASEIIRDLTYNPEVKGTDVMYQPLLPVGSGDLLSCQPLIEGNRFERNLLALLPKLEYRHEGAEALKRDREQVMISELRALTDRLGLLTWPRLKLGEPGHLLTDIDLLIWDREAASALAVSLKWFYGPDSLQEVQNHDTRYRKAVAGAVAAADFVHQHAVGLSKRFGFAPPIGSHTRIHPVVVSRLGLPSPLVDTTRCPVVTQHYFCDVLRESAADLTNVVAIFSRPPDASPTRDATWGHIEVPFGVYRFLLPAVEAPYRG